MSDQNSPSTPVTADKASCALEDEAPAPADNAAPRGSEASPAVTQQPADTVTALVISAPPHAPMPPSSKFQTLKAFITLPPVLMVLSVFLFSVMILCVKMASKTYNNFEIIAFRGLVGAVCLLIYRQVAFGHGLSAMKTSYLGMQMWRAFIGTMSMACWFYGIAHLSLSTATTLNYMSSIWMALFIIASAMITHQGKPDPKLLGTIILGFVGILVILRPSSDGFELWASLVVMLSSVFAALAYLQVAALGRIGEPGYRTVFYFCIFGAIFGAAAAFINPKGFSAFSWSGMGWMLIVGLAAMGAQLLLTRAYTQGNALVNASLQYLGLVFVIIFDWILGAGWPDHIALIGMGLVVLSGLLATIIRGRHLPQINKHANKHHH